MVLGGVVGGAVGVVAGELLLSVARGTLKGLASKAAKNLVMPKVEKELQNLGNTVSTLEAVFKDAEEQQAWSHAVREWLQELSNIVLDADDLLDVICTDALQREIATQNKNAKKVRIFFSKAKKYAYGYKMGHKIKAIRKSLEVIAKNREFHLHDNLVNTEVRESHSYLLENEVVGREDDKKAIIEILKSCNVEEKVSILPIVGVPGLGKTTLAKYVYNDEEIKEHFSLRWWFSVSVNLNVKIILQRILSDKARQTDTLDDLVGGLGNVIQGKKCLIVLDDARDEDEYKWSQLKEVLMFAAKGSKILVTTCSCKVARITHPIKTYNLLGLDPSSSWKLVISSASEHGKSYWVMDNLQREVFQVCQGIPRALIKAGNELRSQDSREKCLHLLKNKLPEILQDICGIISRYDKLHPYLKRCFIYCSLFPYNYSICKSTLIALWIAQGFIKPSSEHQCLEDDGHQYLEDVGHEYFMELVNESFFCETVMENFDDIVGCKLEHLMHRLAITEAGSLIATISQQKKYIQPTTRHLSIVDDIDFTSVVLALPHSAKRMLTVFCPKEKYEAEIDCEAIFSSLKCLHVLDLHGRNLSSVPEAIGKLKALRYLDLSRNSQIKELPKSIIKLKNLQTLGLSCCDSLEKLPREIQKLIKLRHLKIDGCKALSYMPRGLKHLTDLRTLSGFVVDSGHVSKHSGGLDELHGLNNLRELRICGLSHASGVSSKYTAANLKEKTHLHTLELRWIAEGDVNDSDASEDERSLKGFQPHENLTQLLLEGYWGSRLPDWVLSLESLIKLQLSACRKCQYLPPLSQLTSLKCLKLIDMDAMQYITDYGDGNLGCPSLKELYLDGCPNLERWWCCESSDHDISIPCLSKLNIRNCPKLTFMPMFPHLEELFLENTSFRPLEQKTKIGTNTSTEMASSSSAQLEILPDGRSQGYQGSGLSDWLSSLKNLTKLQLVACKNCTCVLPLTLMPILKCLKLIDMDAMQYVSDYGERDQGCSSLEELYLVGCDKLEGWWKRRDSSVKLGSDCDNAFRFLSKLNIQNCPKLIWMPKFPHLEELFLENTSFEPLGETMKMRMNTSTAMASSLSAPLLKLKHLKLVSIIHLETFPDGELQTRMLPNLTSLEISKCERLTAMPNWIRNCKSLKEVQVVECSNLTATTEVMDHLKSLQSKIQECPHLGDWPNPINSTATEPIGAKSEGFFQRTLKIGRKKN